jgi:hypothetical protein
MRKSRATRLTLDRLNLPMRMPLNLTIVTGLLLDRFHAPTWVWSMLAMLLLFLWLVWIYDMQTRTNVELESFLPNQKR